MGNYQRLCQLSGQATCAASVKAGGYGLGIAFVGPALWDAGCRIFFVAYLQEAAALRALLPDAVIYVFHGLDHDDIDEFRRLRLRPVLNSPEELAFARGAQLEPAIHVDTGMQRLGFAIGDLPLLEAFLAKEPVSLLMSHLASADQAKSVMNSIQLQRFQELVTAFRDHIPAFSLANTAGILLGSAFHFDLTRPGIGLYGGSPDPNQAAGFEPVAIWHASVLQIRKLAPGTPVGYGGSYTTDSEQTVLTLSTGYADGYIRALGNRALVSVNGFDLPVIGRVSMDMITVDATALVADGQQIRRGDWVELMGGAVTIDRLARESGTISYEILTRLGPRLERQLMR